MQYKKTKIVCTLGPASRDPKVLKQMINAGMDVARLNFSHGNHEEKKELIDIVRGLSKELNKPIMIFADLSGPKIRLGAIDGVKHIKTGDKISLSLNPVNEQELPMQFDLSPFVKKGQRIFLNDGLVQLKVTDIRGKVIHTESMNSGWVSSNKGVNIPDTILKGAVFTDKDREDAAFALEQNLDYVALSFIQSADDLKPMKDMIKKANSRAKIIVKVEKNEAVADIEEIVKNTNAVMVARGDLGIETPASQVPVIQQKIIRLCRQYNRPVIVATQMLESMIENPRPTRAEVSDVANAVLDQVDAVMLSAESAAGKYPVEAVTIMNEVIVSVEEHPDYSRYFKINWSELPQEEVSLSAIVSSAASLGYRLDAKLIAATTATGHTTRLLAAFRPTSKILAISHDEQTCNQLALVWGTIPVIVPPTSNFDTFVNNIVGLIKDNKYATKDDKVVIVTGSTVGTTGMTDTIKVVSI